MHPPAWDGKAVHATDMGPGKDRRRVEVLLTDDAARKLAISLARLKQTTFGLMDEVEEVLQALNFVTIGDPESRAAHRQMEAGKGMTPDGGHKAPQKHVIDGGRGGKRGSEWRDRLPDSAYGRYE